MTRVAVTSPSEADRLTLRGSSDLSVGGWSAVGPLSGGGEQDSEPVVLEGSEAVGKAAGLLDEQVDGFCAAVADAVGVEPGQDMRSPHLQGAAEASDLGDRAGGKRADDLFGDSLALRRGRGLVHRPELLVGVPCDGDLEAGIAGG